MKHHFSMFQLLHQSTTPSITATPPFNPNKQLKFGVNRLFVHPKHKTKQQTHSNRKPHAEAQKNVHNQQRSL